MKQKNEHRRVPTIKQVLNYRTKKKEYGQFCSYSFSYALPARYSVLHLTVFCRAVIVEKWYASHGSAWYFCSAKVILLPLVAVIFYSPLSSNARSAYHVQRTYHARSAYHAPKAHNVPKAHITSEGHITRRRRISRPKDISRTKCIKLAAGEYNWKTPSCKQDGVFLAGAQGFEPRKCQSQSLMPYRLAMPQYLVFVLTTYVLYQKEVGLSIAF